MKISWKIVQFLLIAPLLLGALTGCKKDDTTTTTTSNHYYDPKIPFGNINLNSAKVGNVLNLQADVSVLNKIKLTWKIPAIYQTLEHKVVIYKRKTPPADFNLICPKPSDQFYSMCPGDEVNGASLYLATEVEDEQWVDQNTAADDEAGNIAVSVDTDYSYWVFMQINGTDWASGVRIDVHSKAPGSNFALPAPAVFWEHEKWSYGYAPISNNNQNFLQSMDAGNASPGDYRGGIALAASGNILYYADTKNNRVVIWARDGALACEQYTDEYEKSACLLGYIGAPMSAMNILGQEDVTKTLACGDSGSLPNNECLTAPRKVSVVGNRLFISDSGNNRIVVYNHLPTNGCVQNNGSGLITPRDCTPDWVIGKAGLMDLNNSYTLSGYGKSILNNPTDVVGKEDALFIADTGNNRILRIDNYTDRSSFNCTTDTWTSPLCEFSGVLGQEDFYFNKTFASMYDQNHNIIIQSALMDTLHPDYENLLKRYFRQPTRIIFTPDEKMLVLANEQFQINNGIGGYSSMFSRVLIFNTNPIADSTSSCNAGTFAVGDCDANDVIGQVQFNKLFTSPNNTIADYESLTSAIYSMDDMDLLEVPPAEGAEASTQLLVGISSATNDVMFWNNWPDKVNDGYPKNAVAVDPQGASTNPITGLVMPDLQSLCSVRISGDSLNIYINDCGGHKVHEISAADYTSSLGN